MILEPTGLDAEGRRRRSPTSITILIFEIWEELLFIIFLYLLDDDDDETSVEDYSLEVGVISTVVIESCSSRVMSGHKCITPSFYLQAFFLC